MNDTLSKVKTSFKYIYLVMFFTLLAGFFYPLISGNSGEEVVGGVVVLFVGLIGGILLYKSTTLENKQIVYFAAGVSLIAISLALIFQMTGRV
ncbi:MAG: hypothetical protein OEQ12_00515 [Nitrosopumilus sp.]|nr:hypothetical protein [Nitrosopumilus sp.]